MNKRLNEIVLMDSSYCSEKEYQLINLLHESVKKENSDGVIGTCRDLINGKKLEQNGNKLLELLVLQFSNDINNKNKNIHKEDITGIFDEEDDVL